MAHHLTSRKTIYTPVDSQVYGVAVMIRNCGKFLFFALAMACSIHRVKGATYTVINTNNSGAGSLSQAITDANTNAGADIINFNITGTGPFTITLTSLLPVITGPTTINGYSQTGAVQGAIGSRTIMIAINGNSLTGRDGLFRFTAAAGGSSLSGLAIYNTGSSTEAVMFEPGFSGIHVWGNYIGLLPNGASPASATDYNGDDGVFLGDYNVPTGTFSNITIGTDGDGTNDANEGNVIANSADAVNGGDGIQIGTDVAAYTWSNLKISGNYIGIAANGTTAAPNGLSVAGTLEVYGQDGINIKGAANILIGTDGNGTSDVLERNIISGNTGNGININGNAANSNMNIAGNFIGTDKTGLAPIPNGIKNTTANPFCGILVRSTGGNASNILIGFDDTKHTAANAAVIRNIVSGNYGVGIQFYGVSGASNKISGNYIGVDSTGNTALGNGRVNVAHPATTVFAVGIDLLTASNLLIGTDADGDDDVYERNVVSGNIDARGIYIRNGSSANVIAGNYIGVGADGTTAIGNDFPGIHIDASANNRIGSNDDGTNDAAEANIIANNAKTINASNQSSDGIRIANNATQNRISRNIFYSNKATPIDLANDGVSVNDGVTTAAQPNLLLDYPVFTAYNISGTTMTVSGYIGQCNGTETVGGTVISGTTTVQVYKVANDGDQNGAITANGCSRSVAHGEGVQYLGSITVTNGLFSNATFTLAAGASFTLGDKLTGITIDASGNTSEFGVDAAPVGYIYVHKKALNETSSIDFPFAVSGGTTTVPPFVLNDQPAQLRVKDLGAAQNGRLWAIDETTKRLYYRDVNSNTWVATSITDANRVDGDINGNAVYINTSGTVFTTDGTTTTAISTAAAYSGTADIGSGWNGLPYLTKGGIIYKYSGTGTVWTTVTDQSATYSTYAIDVNPLTGDAYVAVRNGANAVSVLKVTAAGVVTNIGAPAGIGTAIPRDITLNDKGDLFLSAFLAGDGWYVTKYNGSWSAKENASFDVSNLTGGVGGELWVTMNSGGWDVGHPTYPYYNIFTRATDGTTISYIDDERVRITPGNSMLIPVTPGSYTITETASSGWDLQSILLSDPTNNSASDQVAGTATLNVAAGEIVNAVFQNGELNPIAMTNSCSAAYLETFGTGSVGTFGSLVPGQTSYHFLNTNVPGEDGSCKIVSTAFPDFNTWQGAAFYDHTSGNGTGRMYAVNAGYDKGEFFRRRFSGIVSGATYSFSAWVANLTPGGANIRPNIKFQVLDHTTQAVLATFNTGDVSTATSQWVQYGFTFTTTSGDIDLLLANNAIGGSGNDLAIDDISFALMPVATPITTVTSTGCGTLGSITVASPVGASYEYSKDAFATAPQASPIFNNLTAGNYTISARFVGTINCIVSKTDFVGAAICGSIWNDANGNAINNSEAAITSGVWINLVDPLTNNVIQSVQVSASGTYSFTGLPMNTNYKIILSNTDQTGNLSLTASSMPLGYTPTGTNLSGTASTANTTGIISINTGSDGLINQNFGIEQPPVATAKTFNVSRFAFSSAPPATYPVVPGFVSIPSSSTALAGYNGTGGKLSGTDAEDCSGANTCNSGKTFTIGAINSNTKLYYDFGAGPVLLAANTPIPNYDPAKLVIYGQNGSGTAGAPIGFTYSITDGAGKTSPLVSYAIVTSSPLPVDLRSFSVTSKACTVMLEWETANEQNFDHFEVESGSDGYEFKKVGDVASARVAAGSRYTFDHIPAGSTSYYRLKMIEQDGSFRYSSVRKATTSCDRNQLAIYPNPTRGMVVLTGLQQEATVQIVDVVGRQKAVLTLNGSGAHTLDLAAYPAGLYIVDVTINGQTQRFRISKL